MIAGIVTALIFSSLVGISIWFTWGNRQTDDAPDDLQVAKAEYSQALDAYDHADTEYIDVAIANMEAAKSRYHGAIRAAREGREQLENQ